MTTQLQPRERSDADAWREWESPDVLFDEARRRRRRRWMAGSALIAVALIAAALILGMAGGGGGGSGNTAHGQPSGSGSGATSVHATASRLFPGAPSTQHYYTGPGPACTLAPRNRYLPAWSGCVSVTVADVSGNGRLDLILSYSRLNHVSLPVPQRLRTPHQAKMYPAEQAMLQMVSPDGHAVVAPIEYETMAVSNIPAQLEKAQASALISVAHVSDEPGKVIFLQTGEISSGTNALAYSLYHGRLVSSGVVLGYRGDGGTRASFQCLAGNPQRLIQHTYELTQFIHDSIYGWWNETTTTYAWHGPRLVKITQSTLKRRASPSDSVGVRCLKGIT
jgi:hypothetical protein